MIVVGTVIQWGDLSGEQVIDRVLWIDKVKNTAILFRLSEPKSEHSLPRNVALSDIEQALNDGTALKRSIHQFEVIVSDKFENQGKRAHMRDEWYGSIRAIVTNEPDCYDPLLCGKMIQEAVTKSGFTKVSLYYLLRKYWRFGKTPHALYPLTTNVVERVGHFEN